MTFRVKNWSRFQHFKDRKPPWVKLYRDLLDDLEWHKLDPELAKTLVMIWLIASEYDGFLPDIETLSFRLRKPQKVMEQIVSGLSHWLDHVDIDCDNNVISERYQEDTTGDTDDDINPIVLARSRETETETETEKKKHRAVRFDAQAHLESFGVDPAVARDWLTLRSGKRLKPTETAFGEVKAQADRAGISMNEALRTCCLRGWGGFNADWMQPSVRANGHSENVFG